jgi:hypothetical protein
MNAREAEDLAAKVLTGMRLQIQRMPRAITKTPDLSALAPTGGRYAVDVKARHDDDAFAASTTGYRSRTSASLVQWFRSRSA